MKDEPIVGRKDCSRRRRGSRIVAIAVLALGLAACGSRPEGVLVPGGAVPEGVSTVDLLVATTRAPSDDPGVLFSGERGSELAVTDIVVSIPPEDRREVGQVQWPSRLPADPLKDFTTVSVKPVETEAEGRGWLRNHLSSNGRVLVFVHGFNNRHEDAVYRFAQIVHDSKADAAPVIFTWPSRASILDYNYDKESTN